MVWAEVKSEIKLCKVKLLHLTS